MYEYCTCCDRLYLMSQLVHLIMIIKPLQHVVVNLLPKIFQLALERRVNGIFSDSSELMRKFFFCDGID